MGADLAHPWSRPGRRGRRGQARRRTRSTARAAPRRGWWRCCRRPAPRRRRRRCRPCLRDIPRPRGRSAGRPSLLLSPLAATQLTDAFATLPLALRFSLPSPPSGAAAMSSRATPGGGGMLPWTGVDRRGAAWRGGCKRRGPPWIGLDRPGPPGGAPSRVETGEERLRTAPPSGGGAAGRAAPACSALPAQQLGGTADTPAVAGRARRPAQRTRAGMGQGRGGKGAWRTVAAAHAAHGGRVAAAGAVVRGRGGRRAVQHARRHGRLQQAAAAAVPRHRPGPAPPLAPAPPGRPPRTPRAPRSGGLATGRLAPAALAAAAARRSARPARRGDGEARRGSNCGAARNPGRVLLFPGEMQWWAVEMRWWAVGGRGGRRPGWGRRG